MKKSLLLLLLVIPFLAQAQLEMDDFESYTVGSFDEQWDATQWVGWFGGASGCEISDEQANSGSHSLKLSDAPSADDIVALLPVLNSGVYELSMMQYIPSGNGAYLNLQHNYTNTAGDWAAEIYFTDETTGVAQINTDGEGFGFPIVHDAWASIRFALNFVSEEAELYYNDQLVHTWVLSTNSAGGAGLNQINGINFFAACGDTGAGCSSLAYYDDIMLTEIPLPDFDLGINTITNPSEYVNVPLTQVQALNLEAEVINAGGMDISNVNVMVNVLQDGTSVFSESLGTVASLASGSTATLNSAASSFTPAAVGNYTVEYTAMLDETDTETANNIGTFNFSVTESIYSRDDGNYTNGIGVNGQTALLGHYFDIVQPIYALSIRISYAGGGAGETVQGSILTEVGGVPTDLLAATDLHTIQTPGAIGAEVEVDLPFIAPVLLEPGRYIFMIEQQGVTSLVLSTSESVFTPNSTIASVDGGTTWQNLDDFQIAMAIQPILDTDVNVQEPTFAPSVVLTPNLTRTETQLRLELDTPQDLNIEVFNINGQKMQHQKLNQVSGLIQQSINVENWTSGVYFVRISSQGKQVSRKLQVIK